MASGANSFKQNKGYFVVLSTLSTTSQFNVAAGVGAGGSYLPGPITTQASTAPSGVANLNAGAILKDMGKTVVSSTHTFRKVQAVVTNGPSVTSVAAATGQPFYIELVTNQAQQSMAASVAYLPGLM